MRLPRGSTSTILALAAGSITIIAVGASTFPIVRAAGRQGFESSAEKLGVVARLAEPRLQAAPPELFAQRLEETRAVAGVDAMVLLNHNKALVASAPSDAMVQIAAELEACDLDRVLAGASEYTPVMSHPDGDYTVGACVPALIGTEPFALVVVGGADFVRPLLEREKRTKILFVLLGALAGLVVMFGVLLLTQPISEIARATRRIGSGERGVRVEPTGPEEIVQVAEAVNALAQSIETREDEIQGRLNVVTQVVGLVAHEVRNPLQSLSLLISVAKTETDPARLRALHDKLLDEVHSVEGVVQKLLRDSGPLQISRTTVDIEPIVEQALGYARMQARSASVEVRARIEGKPRGWVDGSLLRRALENLTLNAVEWARRPGVVEVHASQVGDELVVEIDDDGPGVPPELRDEVFRAYYSSKGGGTGLGLSLVRRVFEAHGGGIVCEASPLGGARFRGTLSLREPSRAT
jgi:signal transduction histidine kinase